MPTQLPENLVSLPIDQPVWDRFFTVFPLVLVGSKEESGQYDIAPKHMAMPLGWQNFFCFVCTPNHGTYQNIRREREFTVSYPRAEQVLESSLAAAPRAEDQSKPSLQALPTMPAMKVDGVLVRDCYLYLECALHSTIDGFGENSLIIGNVVAAAADQRAMRSDDLDDSDLLYRYPLMAYLSPGRLAKIAESYSFPFPAGFSH